SPPDPAEPAVPDGAPAGAPGAAGAPGSVTAMRATFDGARDGAVARTSTDPACGNVSVARPSAPVTAVAPPPATVAPAAGRGVVVPATSTTCSAMVTCAGAPRSTLAGAAVTNSGNTVGWNVGSSRW